MFGFKLHWKRLPVKFFKNNVNASFKSIKIKKKFLKIRFRMFRHRTL